LKSQDVEELISASIAKLVPTGQLFQGSSLQQDDLLTLAMKLWGEREERRRDRTWVQQTVVHGAFPLHPLATYCLQRLNAALAQNERTMFSFLWDQEHGLNHFIQTASAEPSATGWLPLMALADLFAYFEPNLKEKRPDLLLAYNQARSNLGTEWLAAGLEDKILCALVLLEVVSDPALHPDRTLLRHALALAPADEPKLDDALSQLEQALVAYKDQTGRYRLVLPGRANPLELKRLIDKRARELPGSPLELLNNLHGLQPIGAGAYNRDRGTSRQLTARFISPAGLASPATLDTDLQEQDGLAWYVVAASEQELKAARAEALQLTRENDRLAVAVPRQPTNLVACFKGKRALEALRYSSEYQSTDAQDLLRDTGLIGEDYVKAFQRARVFFDNPGNFDWFRKGRTVDVHNPQHLDALVSAMMKDVFPQTPVHGIPQHLKPSGSSKNLQDAVNCLLQAPFQLEPTRRGKKSPKDAILREGAEPLGLIAHVGDSAGYETFDAVPPEKTPPYSYEVWMAIENSLRAGADWQAIVRLLTERPYGLYPSVLQLFTAAFYQVNRDFLEVYEAGKSELRPIDLTAQAVEKLVDEPEKYTIRYQPLTDLQRRYLRGLAERALFPGMHLRDMGSTGAALRNRTAQALRVWWAEQQQGVCRIAGQATADELACVLTNSPPETLQAAVALLRAAQQANVSMTASVLLAELPGHIGLPSDIQGWTNDQVEQALAILESTCAVLKSFPKNFKAHVAWQVGQSFGLEAPPTDCNDALEAALSWRAQLPSGVHSTRLTDQDARDLIHVLDDEPDSFEQAFLNALPYRMRLLTYENWKTMSVCDQYLGRLSKAKGCVEQMAAQVVQLHTTAAPTPTPTTPSAPSGTPPPQVAAEPPAVGTAVAAKAKEGPVPAAVTTATTTAIHGPTTTPPPEASSPTVEQAFAQVHLIFEGLTPLDRQALLQKLRQWYECP
jgi:hypothetical protein